jgi:hypothetical protein
MMNDSLCFLRSTSLSWSIQLEASNERPESRIRKGAHNLSKNATEVLPGNLEIENEVLHRMSLHSSLVSFTVPVNLSAVA